jgi:hypothetical protein
VTPGRGVRLLRRVTGRRPPLGPAGVRKGDPMRRFIVLGAVMAFLAPAMAGAQTRNIASTIASTCGRPHPRQGYWMCVAGGTETAHAAGEQFSYDFAETDNFGIGETLISLVLWRRGNQLRLAQWTHPTIAAPGGRCGDPGHVLRGRVPHAIRGRRPASFGGPLSAPPRGQDGSEAMAGSVLSPQLLRADPVPGVRGSERGAQPVEA